MKKTLFYVVTLLSLVLLSACDRRHNRDNYDNIDNTPPSAPTGLSILNGDNVVDISWNYNYEHDVQGYNVYYSYDYYGKYTLLGSTTHNYFTDSGARNGQTYYYAVAAYDYNGNESDLSRQNISATPRPEGYNVNIFNYNNYPNTCGYSLASSLVVPYSDNSIDFYYDNTNGTPFIDLAWKNSDILDAGHTTDIYDIPYAPTSGWSSTQSVIAIVGHTYVIRTVENNYAKIRISNISSDRIVFDWAFQTVKGNTQLKINSVPAQRAASQRSALNKN